VPHPAADTRRLVLAGTFNVRHVGGYRTASGAVLADRLLWRGDAMHALDDDGRRTLAALGLRTIIDVREDAERDARPNLIDGLDARVVTLPLYAGARLEPGPELDAMRAGDLTGMYERIIAGHGPQIAAVIGELARPQALPALVHCSAGKDRTGIVVGLLLSAIGVSDDDVVADFALTERYLDDAFMATVRAAFSGADAMPDRVHRGADPVWMRAALAAVRASHGDAAAYLIAHGLDPAALDALRAALTDPPTAARGGAR
jgi:protein-tyrosine phosphatase